MTAHGPRPFVATDLDWREHAVCRSEDPELFFPMTAGRGSCAITDEAKKVCGRCPVASACLEYALASGEDWGVFGGHTAEERRAIKRRRRAEAKAVAA